jgi:hypothetical protein
MDWMPEERIPMTTRPIKILIYGAGPSENGKASEAHSTRRLDTFQHDQALSFPRKNPFITKPAT